MTSAQSSRSSLHSLLAAAVVLFFTIMLLQSSVLAAPGSMPLSGYAWSSNVGWISFSGPRYGVFEDKVSGALSGYAWSSNIGWISFSASDGSHPAPAVDFNTKKISGWARACAAFANKNVCNGALDGNSGGWDGWIALSGTATDGSAYDITQGPTCTWTGYAWGSDNIGALSMSGTAANGSPYGVSGNDPATCVHLVVSCSGSPGSPYINQPVTWNSSFSGGFGPVTYSWSGTDSLSGTTASVQKSYATAGAKQATVVVTDTVSGQATSASCNNGSGVTVISCTSVLSASPDTIEQGDTVNLSWSVPDGSVCASSCTGSGFNTGGAISGKAPASVPPSPPSTSYALTCTGGMYSSPPPANTTVTVIVPTVTITANGQSGATRVDPTVTKNATIVWSSSHVSSCSVTKNPTSSGWPRSNLNSPGLSVHESVTSQTVYAIDCVNRYGIHATDSVIVNVLPKFGEF